MHTVHTARKIITRCNFLKVSSGTFLLLCKSVCDDCPGAKSSCLVTLLLFRHLAGSIRNEKCVIVCTERAKKQSAKTWLIPDGSIVRTHNKVSQSTSQPCIAALCNKSNLILPLYAFLFIKVAEPTSRDYVHVMTNGHRGLLSVWILCHAESEPRIVLQLTWFQSRLFSKTGFKFVPSCHPFASLSSVAQSAQCCHGDTFQTWQRTKFNGARKLYGHDVPPFLEIAMTEKTIQFW